MSYSDQMMMAIMTDNRKAADAILLKCLQEITKKLTDIAVEYDFDDMPFVIASMKIVTRGLSSVVSKEGIDLADGIDSHAACVAINLGELKKQQDGGKDA